MDLFDAIVRIVRIHISPQYPLVSVYDFLTFLIPHCLNHVMAVPLRYDATIETILSFLILFAVHACSNDSNQSIRSWSPAENVGKSTNLDSLGVTSLFLLSSWLILRVIASRGSTTNRSRSHGSR